MYLTLQVLFIFTLHFFSFTFMLNSFDTLLRKDMIDEETSNLMQQYYNDDAFYIAADRVYQSSDDEFAGMFGPIQTVAGLYQVHGVHTP